MKKIIISLLVALTVFSSVLFVGCGKVSGIEGTYKVIGARYEAIYPDSDFDVLDEEEKTIDLGEKLEGVTLTADFVVIKLKRNNKFEVTNNNSQGSWKGTYRYENGELFLKMTENKKRWRLNITTEKLQYKWALVWQDFIK